MASGRIPFLVLLGALSWFPGRSALKAQVVVRGVVLSDSAAIPLAGAVIEVAALRRTTTTDAHGMFELADIPSGRHRVQARLVGYQPHTLEVRVRSEEAVQVTFRLARTPVVLDSLSVVAPAPEAYNPRMRGFSDRRLTQPGHFLGPTELKRLEHTDLAGVLRMFQVPIRRTRANRPYAAARPGRSLSHNDRCPVQVFFDGHMLANQVDTFDLSSVRVQNLAGIEYYEGLATIPSEFERGDWQCGVLVLWTRLRDP